MTGVPVASCEVWRDADGDVFLTITDARLPEALAKAGIGVNAPWSPEVVVVPLEISTHERSALGALLALEGKW